MILILYLSTEAVGGDGIIATLIFGLVLGNSRTFFKIFGRERQFSLTGSLREFHDEILFLIRSFFFLFMGLMIDIDVTFIGWGVLLFSLIALARVLAVRVATLGMALSGAELGAMSVMMPRGLFTTLLASTALTYEIPHAPTLLNLSFVVILLTILYATLGTRAFAQIRWAR
jgi:cell volume regulation protein A